MPLTATRAEYATINGVPVPSQIVECTSLLDLWQDADLRGQDRIIPGTAGVRRFKRRRTVTRRQLPLIINGRFDTTGAASTTYRSSLASNVDYLQNQWIDPAVTGDGTVTINLYLPNGITRTGPAHCLALELGTYTPDNIKAVLLLSLPNGALV